jgi:hypothetical protein
MGFAEVSVFTWNGQLNGKAFSSRNVSRMPGRGTFRIRRIDGITVKRVRSHNDIDIALQS